MLYFTFPFFLPFFCLFVSLEHKSELKQLFLNPDSLNYSPQESYKGSDFMHCLDTFSFGFLSYMQHFRDENTILFLMKIKGGGKGEKESFQPDKPLYEGRVWPLKCLQGWGTHTGSSLQLSFFLRSLPAKALRSG